MARSFGDLSENAEYAAARDEQTQNELEITELKNKIKASEEEIHKSKEAALKEVQTISAHIALELIGKLGISDIKEAEIKTALKKTEGK